MPERVVDHLEPVQVDIQDGQLAALAQLAANAVFKQFGQQQAVRKSGQGIVL